jgi:uncharacterized DUF497 family protein
MRAVRYYLDPATGRPHIHEHGVSEDEVEEVLRNAPISQPSRRSEKGELAYMALGQTDAGRYLKVLYARARDGVGICVITAYDLRGKELLAFRRRLRRRFR